MLKLCRAERAAELVFLCVKLKQTNKFVQYKLLILYSMFHIMVEKCTKLAYKLAVTDSLLYQEDFFFSINVDFKFVQRCAHCVIRLLATHTHTQSMYVS